jgi:ATP-dependent DNA helicase RecQ
VRYIYGPVGLMNRKDFSTMMDKARQLLKQVFGFDDFVSIQARVIQHVLEGRDTLAVMPTGGGKSLCFQIPALVFEGLTVVVSPLISLMTDQIQQLRQNGVAAALLNSTLEAAEYRHNVESIQSGRAKLLYVAPETLLKPALLELLGAIKVDCLAIDEVHCVSEWGHDFRPEYRRLKEVRERIGAGVCLGLTATATPQVRRDIKACLGLERGAECIAGFDRPNLHLQVAVKDNAYGQTLQAVRRHAGQSGIIYCATRSRVDQLSRALAADGISSLPYHAGLPDAQRHLNQERFSRDDVQVMVATVAFGMGIDKSNVRFVIHYDLPKNIESYYQEIGRAGRDGADAFCLLLYSYGDIHKIKYLIGGMDAARTRTANLMLTAMLRFVESEVCRRQVLLDYFGEAYTRDNCGQCDNCLSDGRHTRDLTVAAQKLLACVKRCGESFGVAHVIDVLRGSRSQKILRLGHDRLTTYGIGLEHTKRQWQQLARQLLHKGFMVQDLNHGAVQLTPKAWDLFKNQCLFHGVLEEAAPAPAETAANAAAGSESGRAAMDAGLFELLRTKRKELADQAKLPPFVIFSDKTLMEMAARFPQGHDALLDIHGVGQAKAQKYGDAFMAIIRRHCSEKGITPQGRAPEGARPLKAASRSERTASRSDLIAEACNAGRSITELMQQFGIQQDTVVAHLYAWLRQGRALRCNGLLSETGLTQAARQQVLEAFKSLGTDFLRPVHMALNQTVDYKELRLLRLFFLASRRGQAPQEPRDTDGEMVRESTDCQKT